MDHGSLHSASDATLDLLFREARTHAAWSDQPVADATLRQLYDLTKMAPTAFNSQPLRVVFVASAEGKARLKPALAAGNVDKTMAAPVTAILAHDVDFPAFLPRLAPHMDAGAWQARPEAARAAVAGQNGWLQAGYFILAARSLGLDCGPMGGFDAEMVDAAFFAGSGWRSHLLCNLGQGDPSRLRPRAARLTFDEACRVV